MEMFRREHQIQYHGGNTLVLLGVAHSIDSLKPPSFIYDTKLLYPVIGQPRVSFSLSRKSRSGTQLRYRKPLRSLESNNELDALN